MTEMPAAPVATKGYNTAETNWWSQPDIDEQTPELRWPESVKIFGAMRRQDAQVISVLRAVTLPLLRTRWMVDPAGARSEIAQQIAEDLGLPLVGAEPTPMARTRDRFSWSEHLRLALLMLPFGHSFFEQEVRIDDQGRARLRKLGHRPARTIAAVNVAADGGLVSIEQYGHVDTSGPVGIGVNRLVAYVNEREGGNWLGQSLLRAAYKNWLIKDRLLRVQAQTIERNGMGVPRYTGAENEADLTKGTALATAWRSGDAAGAGIPFGAKLDLVGVTGDLPDAEKAIRYHDEQIARAVLAHFLNLGTQTGSWALGSTFADFFTLSLQAVAQQVAETASQHIVEDLVDWNWGEAEPAPKIVFEEIGSHQTATAQAIKFLLDSGALRPDRSLEEALRQQYGLPPKDTTSATVSTESEDTQ